MVTTEEYVAAVCTMKYMIENYLCWPQPPYSVLFLSSYMGKREKNKVHKGRRIKFTGKSEE